MNKLSEILLDLCKLFKKNNDISWASQFERLYKESVSCQGNYDYIFLQNIINLYEEWVH
jgi:hypothetical protein